jgi:hypothetical protein
MAPKQHVFNSVVYFRVAGIGILPGIVLTSRLEQIPDSQDTQEVLTLLYAHPEDEQHATHKAKDIGDVKFTVKPASDKNHFGWADDEDDFEELPTTPAPKQAEWIGMSDGHGGWTREDGSSHTPPLAAVEPAYDATGLGVATPVVEPVQAAPTPAEVFADPEGKTIGVADGAGGYAHIRDNPFPPSAGQGDLTGKPIV